jgi:hypothetical protein
LIKKFDGMSGPSVGLVYMHPMLGTFNNAKVGIAKENDQLLGMIAVLVVFGAQQNSGRHVGFHDGFSDILHFCRAKTSQRLRYGFCRLLLM